MAPDFTLTFLLFTAFVGILVTRSTYNWLNNTATNVDAYVHFVISRGIRKAGFSIPEESPQSYLPGRFSYPCLLHFILASFPESTYKLVDRYFSPAMDLLFGVLIFSLYPIGILTVPEVVLGLFLFIATPQFVRPDQPQGVGLSSRKVGNFFATIALLSFSLWYLGGSLPLLIVAVVSGSLVALSSRFSMQAFAGICVPIAVFISPIIIIIFILVVALSILVSNGYYTQVLSDHIRFSYDYAKRKQYIFLYNGVKTIDTIRRLMGVRSVQDMKAVLTDSIVLRGVIDNPLLVAVAAIYLLYNLQPTTGTLPRIFEVWFLSGVMLFLLTSLYHLRFLGHASRYLEHATLPGIILVTQSFWAGKLTYRLVVIVAILGGIVVIGAYILAIDEIFEPMKVADLNEVARHLSGKPKGRVLVQPRYFGSYIAWKTSHDVNDFAGNAKESKAVIDEWERLFPEKETWVTGDVDWLEERYHPDWVVFERSTESFGLQEPSDLDPLLGNNTFAVYPFEAISESKGTN